MSPTPPRLDRLMLVSLLVVGMAWLVAGVPPWGDADAELFVVGTVYVVVAASWQAVVVTRPGLTAREELMSILALWAVAVVVWVALWLAVDPVSSVPAGLVLGTLTFAMWQLPALAGRAIWRRLPRRTTA